MSGLHKNNLLRGIDYLSAVSGGSWAAGAYKSARLNDEAFFQQLDAAVENEHSKLCDDSLRKLDKSAIAEPYRICNEPGASILLSSYRESIKGLKKSLLLLDPLDKDIGYAFRESWRSMIQANFLQGVKNDVPLHLIEDEQDDVPQCKDGDTTRKCKEEERLTEFRAAARWRAGRPYLIINGTHSEGTCREPTRNFPFQFTADAIGTIADCGNTDYCKKPDFRSQDSSYKGVFLRTDRSNPISTLYLSHAMAISGAVAPANFLGVELGLMEWHLQFPFPESVITDIEQVPYRKEYVLADGGHSDNFGVLPLLERDIGIMIISDAAFDSEERFHDFAVLKEHARSLLKRDIVLKKNGEKLHDLHWITAGATEGKPLLERLFSREKKDFFQDELYDPDSRLRFNGQFFSVDHHDEEDKNLNVQIGSRRYSDLCGDDNADCRKKRDAEFEKHKRRYHGEGYAQKQNSDPITYGYFTRHSASGETGADGLGKVIYVKPPRDLSKFMNYLLDNEHFHIYNYLMLNKGNFPCDKTFAVSYHNELIQSYYLLGKFIAEEYLGKSLGEALDRWPKIAPQAKVEKL